MVEEALGGIGATSAHRVQQVLALGRDGHHDAAPVGRVRIATDQRPLGEAVDYLTGRRLANAQSRRQLADVLRASQAQDDEVPQLRDAEVELQPSRARVLPEHVERAVELMAALDHEALVLAVRR